MALHVIDHPLVQHKLGLLREQGISTKNFREIVSEVGNLLAYEATKDLTLSDQVISAWDGNELTVKRLTGKKNHLGANFKSRFGNARWHTAVDPSS